MPIKPSTDEFYDPSLKPKSTLCYEQKGAKIDNAQICTIDGDKINNLIGGKQYIFEFDAIFNDYYDIQYSMMIKNLKGMQLGGIISPSKTKTDKLDNLKNKIQFFFMCNLNEGYYTVNCSCRAIKSDGVAL